MIEQKHRDAISAGVRYTTSGIARCCGAAIDQQGDGVRSLLLDRDLRRWPA